MMQAAEQVYRARYVDRARIAVIGSRLFVVVLCTGLLAAQTPSPQASVTDDDAPLDLLALAERLDPGTLPSLVELIPDQWKQRAKWLAGEFRGAELKQVWDGELSRVPTTLYLQALWQLQAPSTAAESLSQELRACAYLAGFRSAYDVADRLGGEAKPDQRWLVDIRAPAELRWRGLAARLLRDHGDTPELLDVLLDLLLALAHRDRREDLGTVPAARLTWERLRRLGERACDGDWLAHATACMTAMDLPATEAALARAEAAPAEPQLSRRARAAEEAYSLRQRLLAAKECAARRNEPGLAGRMAQLRFMWICGSPAVVGASRDFAAAHVDHALPYTILWWNAVLTGSEPPAPWAREAMARPGGGAEAAYLFLFQHCLGRIRSIEAIVDDAERLAALDAINKAFDRLLASFDAGTEGGDVLRWLRQAGLPGEPRIAAMAKLLPSAVDLVRRWPASRTAYDILLFSALVAEDGEAARAALLQPIPPALARLHEPAAQRARILVLRDMQARRSLDSPGLKRVLGDLARAQGDPRDADYLRGVCHWWASTEANGTQAMRQAAADRFAAAQLGPAASGWWRVAAAAFVARVSLQQRVDWDDAARILSLCHSSERDPALVPFLATLFQFQQAPIEELRGWTEVAQGVGHPASSAVLRAAMAEGFAKLGDADAARGEADQALTAVDQCSSMHLPHDRGVLAEGGFRWSVEMSSGGLDLIVRPALELWIVPSVPAVGRLKQLATRR